jgi:hypothetical protein
MTKALTPIKAIRVKCRECMTNHVKEIRNCSATSCSLFNYRMGKRPTGNTNLKKPEVKPQGLKGVIKEALQRYEDGRNEHGNLALSTDKRNFLDEAIEEMLDAINYLCFQILKLRRIKT